MNKNELIAIRDYITENTGHLTPAEMLHFYEMFMNGSDSYLLGVEFDGMAYAIYSDTIPLKYCSCQTDHKTNDQFLRFRPHLWGSQEIATNENALCFGSVAEMYTLYTCNTKKGYNSGYCFEKAVYNHYGMGSQWEQDNKASTKGGDMCLNGCEIQMKYVEKNSLATITSTKKILREIEKILKIME